MTMKVRFVGVTLIAAMGLWVLACSNPARPSMSFIAPVANTADGQGFDFASQPITLSITNSARTGGSAVTYTVEVSATPDFAATVFTKDGIPEDGGGTTNVQISALAGNTTYYWHSRATADGVAGEFSRTQSFFIRPNIVFSQPTIQTPGNTDSVFSARPTFTVGNSSHSGGQPKSVSYEFQVSTSSSFATLLTSATVPEGNERAGDNTRTSWTPAVDLPEATLFWRARAVDTPEGVQGPFTASTQFVRKFGVDLSKVVYIQNYPNISTWPQTAKINSAAHFGDQLCIDYSSPDWPTTDFFGDPSVQVIANQWIFANVGGTWYGGAGHWLRPGQTCKGEVDENFFVDAFSAEPFKSLVLHDGDVFGVAISTPARAFPDMTTVNERSDVVMITW